MYFVPRLVFLILVVSLFSFPPALAPGPDLGLELKRPRKEGRDLFQERSSSINKEGQKALQIVIDDFLVNDDTLGGNEQYGANIARAKSGNFVITWIDRRYGNTDIYAQRYNSSGIPQGSNFKVNDDIGIANQTSPSVAMDSSGNFVITWADGRSGSDIYAQRYDSSGIPIGSNFKVNDGSQYVARGEPAVAMNNPGIFVITWKFTPSSDDIYAQRFHNTGTRLGNNFKVNDDSGPAGQSDPDVTIDGSGNFVITWRDTRNPYENYDIYAQRYNCAGNALGSNFMVNDDSGNTMKGTPHIDMNDSGYCIITWPQGGSLVYAQRYDPGGSPLGTNFHVHSQQSTQSDPDVAIDGLGNFVITWLSGQGYLWYRDMYAQRYASSGSPLGSNLKVNDDSGNTFPRGPTIATDSSGNFAITWEDDRNVQPDIYVQMYDSSGTTAGSNFKANDDIGSADQLYPSIALDNSGNFIITWIDLRNGSSYRGIAWEGPDIYAQRYDPSGISIGSNLKVNDVSGSIELSPPVIVTTGSGNSVIAWEDNRNGCHDIYARRYDSAWTPLGSNFKVHSCDAYNYFQFPAVAMNKLGSFVIAWEVSGFYHDYYYYIYAQRFDSSGTALGSSFRVDTEVGSAMYTPLAIAMDKLGNFVITWESGSSDIYAQRYDSSGTTLGATFKVNASDGWMDQHRPAIVMDTLGNFVITWEDETNGNFDIYAQRYDSSGSPLGSNFKVNDGAGTALQQNPAISMDASGKFVIVWEDYRNGLSKPTFYAQRYDSDGNPIGNNYLVPNYQYANFAQRYPAVTSNSSNIYFGWMDNRRAKGWDIYAKVVDWSWTEVKEDEEVTLPNAFELYQNYPNPFNPTTTIRFTVEGQRRPIRTTLKIYNILGQKVRTLVDEPKRAGSYEVIWDGKDDKAKEVASGIYFYQLKVGEFTETKKMLLLK